MGLRRVQRALGHLKAGAGDDGSVHRRAAELKLIEPIDISLSFDTRDERLTLQGLFTVSPDGIRTLSEAAALRLFEPATCSSLTP